MKELKNMIAQAGLTEKDFAWNLKRLVDAQGMTGSEVMEVVKDQTGLEIDKDELYSFLLENCKNPNGEAFSINKMKMWNK